MQGKNFAEFCAGIDAKYAQRALDWQRALDKLSVTFEADHEGGCQFHEHGGLRRLCGSGLANPTAAHLEQAGVHIGAAGLPVEA